MVLVGGIELLKGAPLEGKYGCTYTAACVDTGYHVFAKPLLTDWGVLQRGTKQHCWTVAFATLETGGGEA